MRRIKSRDDNIYQRKSASTHESEDEKSQDDIDEDDEEDDIEKQENAVAMQNSFRLIYNVLSETNSHVVGQVKLFVHELRRVTVGEISHRQSSVSPTAGSPIGESHTSNSPIGECHLVVRQLAKMLMRKNLIYWRMSQ
ncbi:unnamed protein product [Rotaria magnacalcarata]|uniref:Uncharacterized protein n=2 Tax=Rotaria magnacalcarata TaxID=392030 RepID=A0A816PEF9_9BILA|nr:unnamed protein product [Rotaria magnacalcarata]